MPCCNAIERYGADNRDFSGMIIYSALENNITLWVDRYENGKIYLRRSVFDESNNEENAEEMAIIAGRNEIKRQQPVDFSYPRVRSIIKRAAAEVEGPTYEVYIDEVVVIGYSSGGCGGYIPSYIVIMLGIGGGSPTYSYGGRPESGYYGNSGSGGGGGNKGSNKGNSSNNGKLSDKIIIEENPCNNSVTGKANPLINMRLAPPKPSNIAGATFGNNVRSRDNGTVKPHWGIDLAAAVGTPVYAVTSGTITAPFVTTQPNTNKNGKYPAGYKGDQNDAGNRIYVSSGNSRVGYWHLQAGNAVAINPRTGQRFKVGDAVRVGDIIGYVGVTGNANPNVPHLHLNYRVNNQETDPSILLNIIGGISTTSIIIRTPCD